MSNVYKTRELMTIARNADSSITCCLVWYRNSPIEYAVFSPRENGGITMSTHPTQLSAMVKFEQLAGNLT
jgi:hypothetical protein